MPSVDFRPRCATDPLEQQLITAVVRRNVAACNAEDIDSVMQT